MKSQGCALLTKISASGQNALGSSRLPTRRPTTSGRAETRMNSGQPHSWQNARVTSLPASLALTNSLGAPLVMRNPAAGTRIAATYALPLLCWQSRQWHSSENSGSPADSYRTCPQKQPPVLAAVIFDLPLTRLVRHDDRAEAANIPPR